MTGTATLLALFAVGVPSASSASAGASSTARSADWSDGWRIEGVGSSSTCGIKVDNTLWCWGLNSHGQLGIGTRMSADKPKQVGSTTWARLNVGASYTCGVQSNHSLWCWGLNDAYQLGQSDNEERLLPTQIGSGNDWRDVSAGGKHTCAIKTDGSVWCWGYNVFGQVGIGTDDMYVVEPHMVGTDRDWRMAKVGGYHTCALKASGSMWCWGANTYGQLGLGDTDSRDVPTELAGTWSNLTPGTDGEHTCAIQAEQIRTRGTLWCWGNNDEGQLGTGDRIYRDVPTQVGHSDKWYALGAGFRHTCATVRAGHGAQLLYCWGDNRFGQLGIGTRDRQKTPARVDGTPWVSPAGGYGHTCAITLDKLYCWGSNADGQLGVGDTYDRLDPTQVR